MGGHEGAWLMVELLLAMARGMAPYLLVSVCVMAPVLWVWERVLRRR